MKHGDSEIDPRAAAESAASQTADALEDVARVAAKLAVSPAGVAGAVEGAAQGIVNRTATAAARPRRNAPWSEGNIYDALPPDMKQKILNRLDLLPEHRDPTGEPFQYFSMLQQEQISRAIAELLASGNIHFVD